MKLSLKKIGPESKEDITSILSSAPQYIFNIEGISTPPPNSASELLKELPPNCTYQQKHVFLIKNDNFNIGIIDFIDDHPEKNVGFLGLLLLSENNQQQGFGRASYELIETYAKSLGLQSIQLGVNESNPVESFWSKMGFQRNGREAVYQGVKRKSIVRVMEKILRS